jgi:4'-phosphopantetheinyl transferase EntD
MRTLALPVSWRDRALVIVDGEPDDEWFTPGELQIASAFHLPKRRLEWKMGRMAAKQLAVDRGFCQSPREVIVERPGRLSFHLSLSHSTPFAGAAVDLHPVGIDVQTVREISHAAAHLFLTDEEADVMRTTALRDAIIHFWSAKEAAWKRLGGSVETLKRVPLRLESVRPNGLLFDAVETVRIDDVVVALTRRAS